MERFRLLRADEIECRIAQIKENGLSLLLYKTARTDANLLDETVGQENWENDFKVVDGVLYGGIGIYIDGREIWKWDAGTESNTEAEKGRASDAFKRAGFKWGIGRELYTAPFIWVQASECSIKDRKCYDPFEVTEIEYNDKREIVRLVVTNVRRGTVAFSMGGSKHTSRPKESPQTSTQSPVAAPDGIFYCSDCGNEIVGLKIGSRSMSPQEIAQKTLLHYGRQLCKDCAKKPKDEGKAS